MSKFLCSVSFLVSTCCLSLNAIAELPPAPALFKVSFSPINLDITPARFLKTHTDPDLHILELRCALWAERAKVASFKRNYARLRALYIAHVGELQQLVQMAPVVLETSYMKVWPESLADTVQSFSSASRTTGSNSGKTADSDSSSDSGSTISSTGSRLLSPSSDSDKR